MIGDLVVNLGLNSKRFNKGLDQGRARIGSFAKGVVGKIGKIGGLVAGALGVGGLGIGVKLVAEAEQAEVAFTTMLGSAEKAKTMLGDLKKFASSTPFQLGELRNSARQLLAFGVAGGDILPLMKTLGDVAAGTQKPIGDFVDIFGKVKASGIASLGDINRLADRGVPIYTELAAVMGVSTGEIRKLASTGKIGLKEIQAALENTAGAGGLFENSMEKQSKTLAGKWSTMKDTVMFVMKDITQALMDGFDVKGGLDGLIGLVKKFGEGIKSVIPIVKKWASAVKAVFSFFFRVIKTAVGAWFDMMSQLTGASFDTFAKIGKYVGTYFDLVKFTFDNMFDIVTFVFASFALSAVNAFEKLKYIFTSAIPAILDWFFDNWKALFTDMLSLSETVFTNLVDNVKGSMKSIWEFIKSGGEKSMENTWKPLTEGFRSAVDELVLPDQIKSEMQLSLESTVADLGDKLADEFQKAFGVAAKPKAKHKKRGAVDEDEKASPKAASGLGENFGAVLKGTTEAYSAILKGVSGGQGKGIPALVAKAEKQNEIGKKQLKALEGTNKILKKHNAQIVQGMVIQ